MATAKKNTKKTTTKKTTKKPVESTGVVDEFLNENIGKVVKETPKTEPKKKSTKKKETTKKDAEAELNEILSQQITEENIRVADEIEKTISEQKKSPKAEPKKKETKTNEPIMAPYYLPVEDVETIVNGTVKVINEQHNSKDKTPEEKWKDLGLDSEAQEDIKDVVDNILDENGIDKEVFESAVKAEATKIGVSFDEVKQPKEEENDGKHIIEISEEDYQEIAKMMLQDAEDLIEGKEEKKENVENIKIGKKLEPENKQETPNPLRINFVTSAMGVSYD